MTDWQSKLNADPTDWLLEPDDPSVRYFTLKDIFNKSERSKEMKDVKAQIMEEGPVPKILEPQHKGGYWQKPEDFYEKSKYRGTVWSFLVLAELGADGKDERIQNAAEFILKWSQNHTEGGFSHRGSKSGGGYRSAVIPCLTGNMLFSMIRFGYLNDPRIKRGIDWITTYQRFDDKVKTPPKGWPYDKFKQCWGRHTCHLGAIKAMKALAEIPPTRRTRAVKNTLEEGAEYFLKHHLYKKSHKLEKPAKVKWLEFGFPLMYNTDALEMLGIMTKLGYKDNRMTDAVELVESKQDNRGRWSLENTYNGRMLVNIEKKGKPSKWITLNALKALKEYYE